MDDPETMDFWGISQDALLELGIADAMPYLEYLVRQPLGSLLDGLNALLTVVGLRAVNPFGGRAGDRYGGEDASPEQLEERRHVLRVVFELAQARMRSAEFNNGWLLVDGGPPAVDVHGLGRALDSMRLVPADALVQKHERVDEKPGAARRARRREARSERRKLQKEALRKLKERMRRR